MNGPITGTSIQDLRSHQRMGSITGQQLNNQPYGSMAGAGPQQIGSELGPVQTLHNQQQLHYGSNQQFQKEQAHGASHMINQAQHDPYYNIPNNQGYPQFIGQGPNNQYIEDLVKDISDNVPENSIVGMGENELDINVNDGLNTSNGSDGIINKLPELLREPLIIIVLFFILSQPAIKSAISNWIPQTQTGDNGKVSMIGIIIYGIILAALFSVIKKFLL